MLCIISFYLNIQIWKAALAEVAKSQDSLVYNTLFMAIRFFESTVKRSVGLEARNPHKSLCR